MGGPVTAERSDQIRLGAVVGGVSLLILSLAIGQAEPSFRIEAQPPFTNSSKGELFFWLVHVLFVGPGSLVLGWGLAPRAASLVRRAWAAHARWSSLEQVVVWVVLTGALLVAVVGLRGLVLENLPVTDEEEVVRWAGAQLLRGRVGEPMTLEAAEVLRGPFQMHARGLLLPFDWPGGIFFSALSQWTGLHEIAYAALAAAVPPLMYATARKLWDRPTAVLAALLALCSPGVVLLSLTTHAQMLSRVWLLAALCSYAHVRGRRPVLAATLLGLTLGLGFLTRPIETAVLSLPFWVEALARWRTERPSPTLALAFVAGLSPSLAAFALYNLATTGQALVPGRFSPEAARWSRSAASPGVWARLGNGSAYTLLMLALFGVGPTGLATAVLGATTPEPATSPRPWARCLAAAVMGSLLLCLLHDNYGVHIVGQIHQAETSLAVLLLAARGAVVLLRAAGRMGGHREEVAATLALYLLVAMGTFVVAYLFALERQAMVQRLSLAWVREARIHHALVLAPHRVEAYQMSPLLRSESRVRYWPMWSPGFTDDVLIVVERERSLPRLRALFPDRSFFRLQLTRDERPTATPDIARLEAL